MNGLSVMTYRTLALGGVDCTNGGVSARYNDFILFDIPGGNHRPEDSPPGTLSLLLLKRDRIGIGGYVYAVPAMRVGDRVVEAPPPDGHTGWMAGGNYVATSDSRLREAGVTGALPVHDRSEAPRRGAGW